MKLFGKRPNKRFFLISFKNPYFAMILWAGYTNISGERFNKRIRFNPFTPFSIFWKYNNENY